MTIQVSLIIWTVIGFVTLSLILNRFLFKPLLEVMDARNAKIRAREEEKKAELERQEKTRKAMELASIARLQDTEKAREKALSDEKKKTEAILAAKKAEYDASLEKIRADYEADSLAIEDSLSDDMDQLAQKYVSTLIL